MERSGTSTRFWKATAWLVLVPALHAATAAAAAQPDVAAKALAGQILQATGVRGGLVVELGCGEGRLLAALAEGDAYLAQGLDTNAQNVTAARKYLQALGLYGKVSVERWSGDRLPYTDNLVNLVVSQQSGEMPINEVLRVLAPGGVAYIVQGQSWMKTVKPRPKNIDEWTHFLHGPDNNAVAHDTVIAAPYHLQWTGDPTWTRSHDHLAGVSALVSSGGRIFYIVDEAAAGVLARSLCRRRPPPGARSRL